MKSSSSIKVFFALILTLALVSAISILLPQGNLVAPEMPAKTLPPKSVMLIVTFFGICIAYGGLGFIGLKLSRKLGFPDIIDPKISNKQRFFISAVIGIFCGLFLILADTLFSKFNPLGPLPHPPFPMSITASIAAGIGEETIFRLFFIPFWMWLISFVILKKRYKNQIFWLVNIFSALAFAAGHFPSVMVLIKVKTFAEIPPVMITEMFLLNGVISILAGYYLRKFGFLTAVGIHFWADIVWHVLWGN